MDEWEQRDEQQRRETETFRRIHRMVKQGYAPDWSITDVEDAIWLDHPGEGTALQIYPDGKVVSRGGSAKLDPQAAEEHDRIYNDDRGDHDRFDRWLASVPLPSLRERTRAGRERLIYRPGCLVLFFAGSLAFGKALEWLWKAIAGG